MSITTVTELDQLAFDLSAAKAEEAKAREARIAVEEKILAITEKKEEGTVTTKGDYYKVSVVYGIDRKVDGELALSLAGELDVEQYRRIFKWKPEVSVTELKHLRDNKPDVFTQVSRAITSKPSKPSVKVEEIK